MARFKNIILTELGTTTDAYNYRMVQQESDGTLYYEFKTPDYTYQVQIIPIREYVEVDFQTKESGVLETEENEQFKVMATIMKIAKEVWERRDQLFKDRDITFFKYFSVSKPGYGHSIRDKLYRTFIKTQFPNAKIEKTPHTTKITPKQN